ncbi:hypothetical protein Nepgr_032610 [Nepenthes gracilis]|uniref:Uncharacterized protein n=1 Tax=Nepenthes gracilis TaxID=150966 RepID=A0AAD3TL65_NEPGR|nr:hypothetical protein Nepgr_032610 [Nepenthes gracilis]
MCFPLSSSPLPDGCATLGPHKASPPPTDSLPLPSLSSSPSLPPLPSPWVASNEDLSAANGFEDSIDHPPGNGPTSYLSKSPVS